MKSNGATDAYQWRYPGEPTVDVKRFFERGLLRSWWFWESVVFSVAPIVGCAVIGLTLGWAAVGPWPVLGLGAVGFFRLAMKNYCLLRDLIPDWGEIPLRGPLYLTLEIAANLVNKLAVCGSCITLLSCIIGPMIWYARHAR